MWPPCSRGHVVDGSARSLGLSQVSRQACPGRLGISAGVRPRPRYVIGLPGPGVAALVPPAGTLGAPPRPSMCPKDVAAPEEPVLPRPGSPVGSVAPAVTPQQCGQRPCLCPLHLRSPAPPLCSSTGTPFCRGETGSERWEHLPEATQLLRDSLESPHPVLPSLGAGASQGALPKGEAGGPAARAPGRVPFPSEPPVSVSGWGMGGAGLPPAAPCSPLYGPGGWSQCERGVGWEVRQRLPRAMSLLPGGWRAQCTAPGTLCPEGGG